MDLSELDEASTGAYIICQGDSFVQVKAIANNIQKKTREELGLKALHVEGERESTWILLDYFDIVVHVFHPEMRSFYDLEALWSDANFTHYDQL